MLRIILVLIAGWWPWLTTVAVAQDEPDRPEAAPYRGKLVFFGAQRAGETGTAILKMNPDGTDIETVIAEKSPVDMFGRISPDGRRLAYSLGLGDDEPIRVEILEADGGRRQVAGDGWVMAWSPDGGSLLCFGPVDGGWKSTIVDLKSGEVRPVPLPKDDAVEDWSPVGDRISIMVGNRDHVVHRGEDDSTRSGNSISPRPTAPCGIGSRPIR